MNIARMKLFSAAAVVTLSALGCVFAAPQSQQVPPAVEYQNAAATDAVAQLQQRIDRGDVKLEFEPHFGWLRSVLRELQVMPESQILTFGKTSFQAPLISPRRPRALYFNDHLAVGFVTSGDVLEFASVDPRQGTVFYTLDQEPGRRPRFQRRDLACLQCHQHPVTENVPGWFVRSIYPERSGMPAFRGTGFVSNHRSPLKERWGGWYVTGTHGSQRHMGNAFVTEGAQTAELDDRESQNLTSLGSRINPDEYLTPHSDIVALLVVEHQARAINLMTNAGWEVRKALQQRPPAALQKTLQTTCEPLLAYLLMADETPLTETISGTSGFAEAFAKQGPFDAQGRSLRQLDLKQRLFRYRCSYLIYSEAFDALPNEARDYLYRRLWEVLSGKDASRRFAYLKSDERQAIREILLATKKGLPAYWQKQG